MIDDIERQIESAAKVAEAVIVKRGIITDRNLAYALMSDVGLPTP
ncbi:hypothetical protein [Streptomyces goshikiensis]